jgi:hypothetical protein
MSLRTPREWSRRTPNDCHWANRCREPGKHATLDENGEVWALLCDEHQAKLTAALASKNPKEIRGVLAMAAGGQRIIKDWVEK